MTKLRCVIVDDEPIARKVLREFTGQVPWLELAGEFENVSRVEAFLPGAAIDLLFLDIEMPRRSGLQYLKSAPPEAARPLVILTTAFPKYALEGYELDIIDYLLKPVAYARFLKAVQKAKDYLELRQAATAPLTLDSWLFVRSEKRIERILNTGSCALPGLRVRRPSCSPDRPSTGQARRASSSSRDG